MLRGPDQKFHGVTSAVDWRRARCQAASFYKVHNEEKTDVTGRVYAFVPNSKLYVSAKNWQNRMISDKDITRIKRVTFFLSHSVVTDGQASN